jgi:hypothetical protein
MNAAIDSRVVNIRSDLIKDAALQDHARTASLERTQ